MIVSLAEAKLHLRVSSTDEDTLITLYAQAASDNIKSYLNRDIPVDNNNNVPPAIKAACLLMIGDLYENRETIVTGASIDILPTAKNLLYPYRKDIGI